MKINWKIVSGILALVLIYDYNVARKNRRIHTRNLEAYEEVLQERNDAAALTRYYAKLLNEHQVPADAFDRIAIETLLED